MRKITKEAIEAFTNGINFNKSNTEVIVHDYDSVELILFGNTIARKQDGKIFISACGWFSTTTKERLNGIPKVHIVQNKGKWYLNGVLWDGNPIEIK